MGYNPPMKILAPVLLLAFVGTICIALPATLSCGGSVDCTTPQNASNVKCVAKQAVIDCTAPSAVTFVEQNAPSFSKYFSPAGIDWAGIEQALINLAVPEAICVLDNVVEHYLSPAPAPATLDAGAVPAPAPTPAPAVGSGSDSGSPALLTLDSVAVHHKAAELSAKLWPGKKAKH